MPSSFVLNVTGRLRTIAVSQEAVGRAAKQISSGLKAATGKRLTQEVNIIISSKGQQALKNDMKTAVAAAQKALGKLGTAKTGKQKAQAITQVEKSLRDLQVLSKEAGATLDLMFSKKPGATKQIGSLKQFQREVGIVTSQLNKAAQAHAELAQSRVKLRPSKGGGPAVGLVGGSEVALTVDPRTKAASAARKRAEAERVRAAKEEAREKARVAAEEKKLSDSARRRTKLQHELNQRVKDYVRLLQKADVAAEKVAKSTGRTFTPRSTKELQKQASKDIFGSGDVTDARRIKSKDRLSRATDRATLATKKQRSELALLNDAIRQVGVQQTMYNKTVKNSLGPLQKFGNQAALAARRYAAYLLPTTGLFAVIGAIRSSVEAFKEFEAEQTKLAQVLEAPQNSIKGLTDQLLDLSTATGVAGQDVLKVARLLAQAGFGRGETGGQDLVDSTEAIVRTQLLATFGSAEEVVDGLIAVFKQFNKELSDTGEILDIMNQLAKDFATESKDIFEGIKRGGAVFAVGNASFEEFAGLMTLIRAETRESAKMLGTFFKSIGARLFRSDIEKTLEDIDARILQTNNVATRLQLLAASFKDMDAGEKIRVATDISGVRQASRLVNILNAINKDAAKIDISIVKSIGSAERDAAKRLDDLVVKFQQAQREINKTVIKFLDTSTVKTIVNLFTKMIGGIAGAFSALAPVLAPITALVGTLGAVSFTKSFARGMGIIGGGRRDLASKALVAATTTNTGSVTRLTASIDRLSGIESTRVAGGLGPGGVPMAPGTGLGSHLRRGGRGAGFHPMFMTPLGSGGGGAGGTEARLARISTNNLSAALTAFPNKTASSLSRLDRFVAATQRRNFRQGFQRQGLSLQEADRQARLSMGGSLAGRQRNQMRNRVQGQNLMGGRNGMLGRGGFGLGLAGSIIGGQMATSAIEDLERGIEKPGKLMAGSIIQHMSTMGLTFGMIGSMTPLGPVGTGIGAAIGVVTGAIIGVTQALNQLERTERERFNQVRQDEIETFIRTGALKPSAQETFDKKKAQDFFFGDLDNLPSHLQRGNPSGRGFQRDRFGILAGGASPGAAWALSRARATPGKVDIDELIRTPKDERSADLKKKILAFSRARLNAIISDAKVPMDEATNKLVKSIFDISDQFESPEQVRKLLEAFGFLEKGIVTLPKEIFSLRQTINRFNMGVASESRELITTLGLFRESLKDNIEIAKQRTLSADFLEGLIGGNFTPKFGSAIRDNATAGEIKQGASRVGVTDKVLLKTIDDIDREENLVRELARAASSILNPKDLSKLVETVSAFTDEDLLKLGELSEDLEQGQKDVNVTKALRDRFGFLEEKAGESGKKMLQAIFDGVDPSTFANQDLVKALESVMGTDVKRTQVTQTLNDAIKAENETRIRQLKYSRLQQKLNKKLLSINKELLNLTGQFEQQQAQRFSGAGLMDQADVLRAGFSEIQDALLLEINGLINGVQFLTKGKLGQISTGQNFSKVRDVAKGLFTNISLLQKGLADLEVIQQGGYKGDFKQLNNVREAFKALGIDLSQFGANASKAQEILTEGLDESINLTAQLSEGLKNGLSAGIKSAQLLGQEFKTAFDFVTGLGKTFLSDPKKVQDQAKLIDSLVPGLLNAIDRAGVAGISRGAFKPEDILNPAIQKSVEGIIGNLDTSTLQELLAALNSLVGTENIRNTEVSGKELQRLIELIAGQKAATLSNLIPTPSLTSLHTLVKDQEAANRDIVTELQKILDLQRAITKDHQGLVEFNETAFVAAFSNIPETIKLVAEPVLVTVNLTGADAVANAITKQAQLNIGNAVIEGIRGAFVEEGIPFPQTPLGGTPILAEE